MKLRVDSLQALPAALLFLALAAFPLSAATHVVTNTDDSGPGSLRQALLDLNAAHGGTIAFNVGSGGVQRIRPLSALPPLTAGLLDGRTQPGYAGTPLIEIDGSLLPAISTGLWAFGNATVRAMVVNRFSWVGVELGGTATLLSSFIGTDPTGEIARPNLMGVRPSGNATVGGTLPGEGNLISGNHYGISIESGVPIIRGNFIGTNASGLAALPNLSEGIEVRYASAVIGGFSPGAGNLISGNDGYGIGVHSANGVVIQGNTIGPDANGEGSLLNQRLGIAILGSSRTIIGGGAGAANVIAHHWETGIAVGGVSVRNRISRNSLYANAFGIDLGYPTFPAVPVTPNDPGDEDSGPNLLQNFPDLASATVSGGATTIRGALDTSPNETFMIEFFSSPFSNVTGHGEGKTYLGSTTVATDSLGQASFNETFVANLAPGQVVTATATDAFDDTSEFSQAATAVESAVQIESIVADSGPAEGGVTVTIVGTSFQAGASVEIGDVAAADVVVSGPEEISATVPPLVPGTLNLVLVTNPDLSTGALADGWFADFLDVPGENPFHDSVETIFRRGITSGCGGGLFCVATPANRAQMAVLLLKAKHGSGYVPDPATGTVFSDVSAGSFAAAWIEQLAAEGITSGCGGGKFCPNSPVTRAQMAVFLLRASLGSGYTPPAPTGTVFADVSAGSFAAAWIEDLAARGITSGCGAGNYCPNASASRGQMAVFLVRAFEL